MQAQQLENKNLRHLFQNVVDDVENVARLEIQNIREQFQDEIRKQQRLSLFAMAAGVAAVFGFGLMVLGFVHVLELETELPRWACDLVAALILFTISGAILAGRKKWAQKLNP